MSELAQQLLPIEEVFNPHSSAYLENPIPQCLALLERGRFSQYTAAH